MDQEAAVFKALSEPTRLRLMVLLAQHDEICVCKLCEALATAQFRISRHLGILRKQGLVLARREGTWMHYRLAVPGTPFERSLHDCLRRCLAHNELAKRDVARLHAEGPSGNKCNVEASAGVCCAERGDAR